MNRSKKTEPYKRASETRTHKHTVPGQDSYLSRRKALAIGRSEKRGEETHRKKDSFIFLISSCHSLSLLFIFNLTLVLPRYRNFHSSSSPREVSCLSPFISPKFANDPTKRTRAHQRDRSNTRQHQSSTCQLAYSGLRRS